MFRHYAGMFFLLTTALAIHLFSSFPAAVESYYSNGIYPFIGYTQRILFGWIPFSVGDVLYGWFFIWLMMQLFRFVRRIRMREADRGYLLRAGRRTATVILSIYVVFNLLWGLNYNRRGLDYQLQLDTSDYSNEDLLEVTRRVAGQLNALQEASERARPALASNSTLFDTTVSAYQRVAPHYPLLTYRYPSVKPSIYSYLGNYLGFTGYYNPFSGEAQVNTAVPLFIRPFTSCHEIGHQLGYAKESEANFAAYLSATASRDTAFLYSVYFQMFAYASRYVYVTDSIGLKKIMNDLTPGVKKDIRELRAFIRKYSTPLETAIDRLYSQYLRVNEQPAGRMSYNEVVGMLVAYYRKHGKV